MHVNKLSILSQAQNIPCLATYVQYHRSPLLFSPWLSKKRKSAKSVFWETYETQIIYSIDSKWDELRAKADFLNCPSVLIIHM